MTKFIVNNKTDALKTDINRPRSIYQYSNMAPRLSGQTSIFGVVFFLSKSLLGIEGQKPRIGSRARTIYRTWATCFLEGLNGGGGGGPHVGCRLKLYYFVGCRLKFSTFVGCR